VFPRSLPPRGGGGMRRVGRGQRVCENRVRMSSSATLFGLIRMMRPDVNSLGFSANPSTFGLKTICQTERGRARMFEVLAPASLHTADLEGCF
jgi:hypothetical protein